jgi:hypothetical protein
MRGILDSRLGKDVVDKARFEPETSFTSETTAPVRLKVFSTGARASDGNR